MFQYGIRGVGRISFVNGQIMEKFVLFIEVKFLKKKCDFFVRKGILNRRINRNRSMGQNYGENRSLCLELCVGNQCFSRVIRFKEELYGKEV